MPIGADVSAQYTEEAVGGGHPTKARVIDRLALVEHHVDGKHNASKLPVGCGGYFRQSTATECRLERSTSPGNLWGDAIPFNPVSGDPYFLPLGAAKTISNAGLAANTAYYAYAYDNSGVVALELSAAAPDLTTNKLPIKTGDVTRTLVGMARTDASVQFVDTAAQRFVISFWNRVKRAAASDISIASTPNAVWTSLNNLQVLAFAGDAFEHRASGFQYNDTAGHTSNVTLSKDPTIAGTGASTFPNSLFNSPAGGNPAGFGLERLEAAAANGVQDSFLFIRKTTGSGLATVGQVRHEIVFWG
ncbi:MAG: hypothetical protein HYZ11_03770 [Candidatus Tectomicrobia bacterium]|uniref:Uncharacterized protein n=1 Tax=Tectimicrobiota bacterium TaxID=2528274 RepID=A0A932HVZ6_UNCTE|nr:hypothetical protein [Candidatus Tectomicrobia bacterium]